MGNHDNILVRSAMFFLLPLSPFLSPIFTFLSSLHMDNTIECVSYFLIGFFAFPPHMLCGLAARELAPNQKVTATAAGIVKLAGQFGGACAGSPLGLLLSHFGWSA